MNAISEWAAAQQRVIELTEGLDAEQAGRHVPACPDWTVRDLLSHMIGLGTDVLRGDEPDDHNEAWTQRQVDERAQHSVAELLEEWRGITEPMQQWMRENSPRPIGDVTIHEQDLRGALGVPGAKDTAAIAMLRDRMAGMLAENLTELDLPPIALVGPGWQWSSAGEVHDAPVRVEASDFELARAVMSRRSANQLRGWTTRGDVTPYLDAFGTLGPLPADDLSE